MGNWDNLSMRDKRDVMRLHIQNGIRDLNEIRESYNSFGDGGFTQRTDAIQSYAPRDRFKPIPISQEQQFNLKHFGQFNRPEQRQQTIQQPSKIKESQESKRLAEEKINTRERLQRFEEEQRIDKERELKVAPYAAMGLVGAATGTLPAMIAGEVGGRTVDYGSKKLTGKSWGENVLPEAPMIGELTNPGYLVGGLSAINNMKMSKPLSSFNKIDNVISFNNDFAGGIYRGANEYTRGSGRKLSEIFPITKTQQKAAIESQNIAHKEGIDFVNNWVYDGYKMRPEVRDRIENILNVPSEYARNYSPFLKDNPLYKSEHRITSSSSIFPGYDSNMNPETIKEIAKERGKIGGVNMSGYDNNDVVTLRNHGLYSINPKRISDVGAHEAGHSMQNLGTEFYPWSKEITAYNTNRSNYYTANEATKIGSDFKDAMVEPIKTKNGYKNSWEASPSELHSELMVARKNYYNVLKEVHNDPEKAMKILQNPRDIDIDHMISDQDLNRFFKKSTSDNEKRRLIRLLPSVIGVGGMSYGLSNQ